MTDKIPITVEVPKADVWVRNDYRDIVRRLGEVHMIRACEHQHDDDFVPLYDIETLARYQIELERLRADAYRYRWLLENCRVNTSDSGDLGIRFNCDIAKRGAA